MRSSATRFRGLALLAVLWSSFGSVAHAYPSAVIFTPVGASLGPGVLGAYYYAAATRSQGVLSLTSWAGVEVGVSPTFGYGSGEGAARFGGVEIGLDVFGTNAGSYRFVLNAKTSLLVEGEYWPAIAVGVMQVDPENRDISLDMAFVVLTKSVSIAAPRLAPSPSATGTH